MTRKETHTIGQIPGSAGGRRPRRPGPLCGGHLDHGEIRRPVSAGHVRHQYNGRISHRSPDDAPDRAIPTASQLAVVPGLESLLTERFQPHPNWRLFLVVGILGGYTTFSSFEYETYQAVRDGERWLGLMYVGGSVMLGYLGVWLGSVLAGGR